VAQSVWRRIQEEWQRLRAARSPSVHEPEPAKRKLLREANLPLVRWAPAYEVAPTSNNGALWTLLGLAGGSLFVLVTFRKKLRHWIHRLSRRTAIVTVISIVTAMFLTTVATYWFEHSINENFSNLPETLWSTALYISSGLENRRPYTEQGKVTAAMGLVLGPMLFATLTAWMAATFIQWGKRMPRRLKDHYLVLNWNPRALEVIRQIHHPVVTANDGQGVIVVLTDDINVNLKQMQDRPEAELGIFEDVFVSLGDPTDERSLLNANTQDSSTVVVLADDRLEEGADERTIRSVFMIRKIAKAKNARLHVVAELVDPANTPILDEMSTDFPGMLEVLPRGKIHTHLLAQAALNEGVVDLFDDLLSVSEETNEIYAREIPPEAAGLEFPRYSAMVLQHTPDVPLVPVGVQRQVEGRWTMFCNPKPDCDAYRLERGDRLVVLAYKAPPEEELPAPVRTGPVEASMPTD
jgi:hypothetical protein